MREYFEIMTAGPEELAELKLNKKVIDIFVGANKANTLFNFIKMQSITVGTGIVNVLNKSSKKILMQAAPELWSVKSNNIINTLNNIKIDTLYKDYFFKVIPSQGIGYGEFLLAWLFPNTIISGPTVSFDLTINGIKVEVKSLKTKTEPIRFGTSTAISRFKVWDEVIYTIRKLEKNINKIKKISELKSLPEIKYILKRSGDIKNGAFNGKDIKTYETFYKKLNEILHNVLPEKSDSNTFTRGVFKGSNIYPKQTNIEPLPEGELDKQIKKELKTGDGKITLELSTSILKEVAGELRDLFYIRFPNDFQKDLNKAKNTILSGKIQVYFIDGKEINAYDCTGRKTKDSNKFALTSVSNFRIKIMEKSR